MKSLLKNKKVIMCILAIAAAALAAFTGVDLSQFLPVMP